jgi:excinuclease ABC subunit C
MPCEALAKQGRKCKPCFNASIGLCPGVCSGAIGKTEYRKLLRRIVLLFEGKKSILVKSLERDMKVAAKEEKFEEASRLKKQLFALQHIQDVSLIKDEYRQPSLDTAMHPYRIESYDVAHLRGSAAVGVMTVVEDGQAIKNDYRKFKLRATKPGDDAGGLREILSRRLGHEEWPMPRLIVVDGSTAQLNAAESVLANYGIRIPVVGVTKDDKHRPRDIKGDRDLITSREREILLANAEAHRFAIGYHRNKRSKEMFK